MDCSIAWQDNVETSGCVTKSLLLNSWITMNASVAMSPDDQRALLMGSLNQFLNGSFHTIVELSARFVPWFSVNYKIKRTAADWHFISNLCLENNSGYLFSNLDHNFVNYLKNKYFYSPSGHCLHHQVDSVD